MTIFALALGLAQTQNPVVLHGRVITAAIFKPGIVMLTREVEVPAGSGYYALDDLPDALDGTFWYGSTDGAEISRVDTTIRLSEQSKTFEAKTIPEWLFSNVGKHITMKVPSQVPQTPPETVSATLVELDSQSGAMTLRLDGAGLRTINASQVLELDTTGLAGSYTRKGAVPTLQVRFNVSAPKAAHVRFSTLEPGATWVASYQVDLGGDNACTIDGKAQIGLGGLKFEDTDVKLMAGFPNLQFGSKYDLSAGFGSLDAYLHNSQSNFANYRPGTLDPYDVYPTWLQQMKLALARFVLGNYYPYYAAGGFGGGMGGGGFDGSNMYESGGFNRSGAGQLLPNDTSIFRSESLYAYPIGKTTLEPGDRLTKLLFGQHTQYKTIYKWDPDHSSDSPEENLRVHNSGKTPWTGGMVTITKDGLILAQTNLAFTAVGKDADLGLGRAPDVLMSKDTQEIKVEPIPNPKRPELIDHRRITDETKIVAENTKDEAITVEISWILEGEVKADGAKIEKLPRRYTDSNAKTRVTWQLQLAPGEQKRVTATNTFVR